jgi:hypothetical protein
LTSTVESGQRGSQQGGEPTCQQVLVDEFDSLPAGQLDQATIDAVTLLREEEKLARDVYLAFTAMYDLPVFPNIARSEQHHMDLVAMILDRYELPDPAALMGIGEFSDPWVQDLYDDLTLMGSNSLIDALIAGATIEDVDIYHLEHILEHQPSFDDINLIVQNMVAGSRNHMRGFIGALDKRNETYEPGYITQEEFDLILSTPMETGVIYDQYGDVLAECGRSR